MLCMFRYDKVCRELSDKEEILARARQDLASEQHTSASSPAQTTSIPPDPAPTRTPRKSSETSHSADVAKAVEGFAAVATASDSTGSDARGQSKGSASSAQHPPSGSPASRRDGSWMLESFGIAQVRHGGDADRCCAAMLSIAAMLRAGAASVPL